MPQKELLRPTTKLDRSEVGGREGMDTLILLLAVLVAYVRLNDRGMFLIQVNLCILTNLSITEWDGDIGFRAPRDEWMSVFRERTEWGAFPRDSRSFSKFRPKLSRSRFKTHNLNTSPFRFGAKIGAQTDLFHESSD